MVAPNGRTNDAVRFRTPARSSTHERVSGSVPLLDALENAVKSAGDIARA